MKTIKTEIYALMTDVKIIGKINEPIKGSGLVLKHEAVCLISEKNLVNMLKTLGTIPASELAKEIAGRIMKNSDNKIFNDKILMDLLNEEIDNVQFAVDCGDLLIGDDSDIKKFIKERKQSCDC